MATNDLIAWWEDPAYAENFTPRPTSDNEWDAFFMDLARITADMSKCGSRAIGAVLVKDKQILSMGFNGSPMGTNFCQTGRTDKPSCPRRKLEIPSGQGIELCPAQHAEENTIHNAARNGVATLGATLYCYCGIPCQRCAGALINAGIKEVIAWNRHSYGRFTMSRVMFEQARILVRTLYEDDEDITKR
jgi:dCMP deaminase